MDRNKRGGVASEEKVQSDPTLPDKISAFFQKFSIGSVEIKDGYGEYNTWQAGEKDSYVMEGFQLRSTNFGIDTIGSERAFASENIHASLTRLTHTSRDESQILELGNLLVETQDKSFSIASTTLSPAYPKNEFASKTKNHADWTQVKAGEIKCEGVEYDQLITGKGLNIDSISIQDVDLQSYKNRHIGQEPKIKSIFHESIQKIPFDFGVRKVKLTNLNVAYEELPVNSMTSATITISGVNATMDNLTNILSPDNLYMLLSAKGKFMDAADIEADFKFPFDPANKHFNIKGTMGYYNLTDLTRILRPLENVEVKSGILHGLTFDIDGTAQRSNVNMTMLYDDLSVMLYKNRNHKRVERRVLSFLAGNFIINNSNPDKRGERTGDGTAKRDHYKSQFNYLWKSLLPGIKKTITNRK